jgi:short-subunit dehydrogenase
MPDRTLALVTGASSGIGLELARQFATHDVDVVVTAGDAELTSAATELRATGATVHEVRADLRTADGVEHLWREVTALGRPLDAAALNAGWAAAARSSTPTCGTSSTSST